jgi:nitrile hydratase accessory protein
MSDAPDRLIADMQGPAALPRKNGELIFEAPWEARAFGLAVALNEQRRYPWAEFRSRLEAELAASRERDTPADYYERWLASFETMLVEKGVLRRGEIEVRTAELAGGHL